jgi:hypothetical protein
MKSNLYFRILTLRILLLGVITIFWSYVSDYIQLNTNFFGDTFITFSKRGTWRWGWRHHLWCVFSLAFSVIYIVRIVNWSEWFWESKGIPNLKSKKNNYLKYTLIGISIVYLKNSLIFVKDIIIKKK